MDSFTQIVHVLNEKPKQKKKKKTKEKDVFTNSKTPNKVISMMTGYKY